VLISKFKIHLNQNSSMPLDHRSYHVSASLIPLTITYLAY